jgi:hypothetical protein
MQARGVAAIGSARILGLVLLVVAGCQNAGSEGAGEPSPVAERSDTVTGTVRYLDVEGGFYGIVGDDGTKLDPVNLPEEFRKDGLRIRVRVVRIQDMVTLRLWGTPVRIVQIQRLKGTSE